MRVWECAQHIRDCSNVLPGHCLLISVSSGTIFSTSGNYHFGKAMQSCNCIAVLLTLSPMDILKTDEKGAVTTLIRNCKCC